MYKMYNYSFYCTYLDVSSNENKQDTVYRQEILKAFQLMIYDHEKMMNIIDNLYEKFKENFASSIQNIYEYFFKTINYCKSIFIRIKKTFFF